MDNPAVSPAITTKGRAQLVVHFQFRLSPETSIGPALLRLLWSTAADSRRVKVGRQARRSSSGFIYSLYAPMDLQNIAAVEIRLRALLDRHVVGALPTLTRMHV